MELLGAVSSLLKRTQIQTLPPLKWADSWRLVLIFVSKVTRLVITDTDNLESGPMSTSAHQIMAPQNPKPNLSQNHRVLAAARQHELHQENN